MLPAPCNLCEKMEKFGDGIYTQGFTVDNFFWVLGKTDNFFCGFDNFFGVLRKTELVVL